MVGLSCSNYNKSQRKDTINNVVQNSKEKKIGNDSLIVECNCSDSLHKIKVISEYLENENSSDSIFILTQKVIFYNKNKPILLTEMPFRKTSIKRNGKNLAFMNTFLYKAKCLTNKKGKNLFSFYGAHTFDPQHEFFSIFSDEGKMLWHHYGDRYEVFSTSGNDDKYVKEFGEELNSLDSMILLFNK